MELKKFYVYIHLDPRDRSVRYAGKGTGDRAWRLKRRSGKHKSWLKSLESKGLAPIVEIVEYFDSEKDALNKEAELIRYFLATEPKFCNMIDGGIGCPAGEKHPMFGKKHTEETKSKMSKSGKGKEKTALHKEKIGLAHKGKPKNPDSIRKRVEKVSKPVQCIELKLIFSSISDAAIQTKVDRSSIIRICKGKQKTSWNKLTFTYV